MKEEEPGRPPAHGLLRLLIIEDDPADVELMVVMLKRAGFPLVFDTVDRREDLPGALSHGEFDLILCDHNLRNWNGLEALGILRRSGKDIPFVVVTAVLGDEAAVEYLKQGAADYVLKHRLSRLPVAVQQAMQKKLHREEATRLHEQILAGKREWELTFDSVPDLVLLLNLGGEILRANRAAVDLLGMKFTDVIGRPCWEVMPCSPNGPNVCPHYQTMRTGQTSRRAELVGIQGRSLECTANPLRGPEGDVKGCVTVLHDLTERRQAEQAIQVGADRYAALISTTSDGYWRFDHEGKLLDVNDTYCRMSGYTREELLARRIADLEVVETPEEVLRHIRQVMAKGFERFESKHRKQDGGTMDVEISVCYFRGLDEFLLFAHDITERKQASEALRAERQRLFEVLEALPAMICLLTPDYHVAFANRAFRARFGESLGRRCYEYCYGQSAPCEFCQSYRVLKTGQPHHWELFAPDASVLDVYNFLFRDVDGSFMILEMNVDITERKRAESQLAEQLEELRRWHQATLNREDRILELKRQVNELLRQHQEPPRYPSAGLEAA